MGEHRGNECQTQGAAKAQTQGAMYAKTQSATRARTQGAIMRKQRNRNEEDGDKRQPLLTTWWQRTSNEP